MRSQEDEKKEESTAAPRRGSRRQQAEVCPLCAVVSVVGSLLFVMLLRKN